MKLTKCSHNHFYDGDKYSECPHCNRDASKAAPVGEKLPSKKSGSHTVSSQHQTSKSAPQTDSMWDTSHRRSSGMTEAIIPGSSMSVKPENEQPQVEAVPLVEARFEENVTAAVASPLLDAVNAAKSTSVTEDTKTMAFYNISSAEPVVGWLVCVKGEYFGESFNLKTGRNLIGRSLKMDIPLAKEPSVSRDRHAIITYEPKKRKFYIQPGEGNGLTYVNEDLLMVPLELKNYDKVQIGNSEFIFNAFCSELFTWDDYV